MSNGSLFTIRSAAAEAAMAWFHAVAEALDETGLYFNKQPIPGSAMVVDAFVYTKQRKDDGRDRGRRDEEREDREMSVIDEQVAHLYERSSDWDERVKRRWPQAIQPARTRLGLRGSPGSGKTFLTKHAAVTLARESANRIEERKVHLHNAAVPFWITARALAVASSADAKELVVNACVLSLERIRKDVPKPPMDWLRRAAESPEALIVVDALDELAEEEAAFKLASPRLKDVKGRLIATCRTLHWEQRANWLGWANVIEVELAPFERREQREFARKFPPGLGAPGLEPLLLSNFPLRQACSSPLPLTFVCLLLAEGKNLAGANRVTVYIEIVRNLLSGEWRSVTLPWKGKRGFEEEVLEFLEKAALSIFEAAPTSNIFTLAQFKKTGGAPVGHSQLIDELVRCGLLVAAGEDKLGYYHWSFLHRTFLEFLAGRALARKPRDEWLHEPKKHFWYEPEWMEVITFLAAHVEDATPLIGALEQEEEDIFYSMLYLKVRLASAARQVAPGRLDLIAGELDDLFLQVVRQGKAELWPYYLAIIQLASSSQLGERVITALLGLLRNEDALVRWRATQALAKLGDASAAERPLGLLRSSQDSDLVGNAAESLGALEDPRAVEPLISLLRCEDYGVRWRAALALGQLGDPRAVEPLISLLRDDHFDVRGGAVTALARLGDARAVEPLLGLLQDRDSDVRNRAAEVLGQLGDARAAEPLLGLLQDERSYVRSRAAEALGQLGDARAVGPLLGLLQDAAVRRDAARALGQLGDARAVEPLIGRLRNEDSGVRWDAAVALAQFGDARAFEPLLGLLRDEEQYVRGNAPQVLGRLGDARAVKPLLRLLRNDNDSDLVGNAAEALGELGDARAVEPLVGLLRSSLRWKAALALAQLGDSRAFEPLLQTFGESRNDGERAFVLIRLRRLVAIHRTKAPLLKLRRDVD